MRAAIAPCLLILCLLAAPVLAAEKDTPGEGAPGTNVDMPFVIAPMTLDGKLVGYAYVQSRLAAATPADAIAVRDKIAFVLDAFVRDVNGASITLASDAAQVDRIGLAARMLADARRIMGPSRVKALLVTDVQIAPLHPSSTPSNAPPPPQAPAVATAKSAGDTH